MKQQKPRKKRPTTFTLKVKAPEGTIIHVEDRPINEFKEILALLDKKL